MLNLQVLAKWARNRATEKTENLDNAPFEAYNEAHQPFNRRLMQACQKVPDNPKAAPHALFIAVPERLLDKVRYLCLGKVRTPSKAAQESRPVEVTDEMVRCLGDYEVQGQRSVFANLTTSDEIDQLNQVLVCHGLSPIEDSVLLLADLGRAHRVAKVLGLRPHVMLADISWMSSNRSIRQFPTLNEAQIDTGLRVCLDKRGRLYTSCNMTYTRHEIAPYDRAGMISGKKLDQISQRYQALVRELWGEGVSGRLYPEAVKKICQQLDRLPLTNEGDIPSYLGTLGQFPGVLGALEEQLKPHLEILRVIAKQFNSFDEEVFSYFFAQYYAQDSYRGSALKIAPASERAFDEPFDKLDPYFRAWGEGHSTTDILSGSFPIDHTGRHLSALYVPQYRIGDLSVLPYTPLSLDALRQDERDHVALRSRLIMLELIPKADLDTAVEKSRDLLAQTPTVERNRLIGDVVSFIGMCFEAGHGDEVQNQCSKLGSSGIDDLFSRIWTELPSCFQRELELNSAELNKYWVTWLETVEVDHPPDHVPVHLYFYLLDESDWTEELLRVSALLIGVAQLMYTVWT